MIAPDRTHPAEASMISHPTLLMCAPTLFSVDYVINPWMSGNIGSCSQPRAMRQWQTLYTTLRDLTSVSLIEPAAGSPDMVFTANAGLTRDGIVALSSFLCTERQGEEQHFRRWFADAGYRVVDTPRETPFEGEGDALFSTDGSVLWVGYGPRTSMESHAALSSIWTVDVIGLDLVDPRFYHLDTCFAPLTDGSLLFYPAAFSPESIRRIEAFYAPEQRIAVCEDDAVCFACNAVNLGQEIVLHHVSRTLEHTLRDRGFHLTQLPLDEFLKAGGAAKCLVLQLTPTQHAPLPNTSPEGSPA